MAGGLAGTGAAAAAASVSVHRGLARVGSAPTAARGARRLGALADSAKIQIDVVFAPRSAAALQDYATNVSSPGNSLFRHYLTVGQFASRFGPSASVISAVESSLRKAGLHVGPLAADRLTLPVTATAGQFARAFSIGFERYRLSGGRVAFANTKAPMFPAADASYVQAVVGLDDLTLLHPLGLARPAGVRPASGHRVARESPQVVTGGPQPCATAVADAPGQDAYTADQIASAYQFSALYGADDEGAGVTVALLELEPNLASDIAAYQSCYGTSASVKYIPEDGFATSGAGSGEAALDIEDLIGLAPEAAIDVYQAPNTETGLIDDYTAIVDNTAVKVVSTSWGECEADSGTSLMSAEGTLFEQAATEGMSVYAAAGDSGSTDCGTSSLAVDDPGSQPYVTSVGGTSLTSVSPPAQTVWNDSSVNGGAGGGGISESHVMPAYQSSAPGSLNVINANSSGSPCKAASGSYCREVPDVSASADEYHGYLIYWDGAWGGIGGTSAAAPLWAAFTALTDASAACEAGSPVGFANPMLYEAAGEDYSADFTDITTGTNDYTPDKYTGGLYPAGQGYDMASGLGTPNGSSLPQALCAAPTVTVTSPGNQAMTVGVHASLQMTATDSSGSSLTFSAAGLPAGLSITSAGLISGTPGAAGTYSVTVTATDSANTSGSVTFSITVGQGSQVISFTAPATGTVGKSATLAATGGGSGNPVVFTVDPASGAGVCKVSGTDGATVSYAAAGNCVVDANQAGNASYLAAPQVTQTIAVSPAARAKTSTTLTLSKSKITYGHEQTEHLTVTVRAASGAPAGTVTVKAGRKVICTVKLKSGKGTCTLAPRKLKAGSYTLIGSYPGNTGFAASTSPKKKVRVVK